MVESQSLKKEKIYNKNFIQYFWELWNKGAQDKKIKTFQKTKIFNYGVFIQTRK